MPDHTSAHEPEAQLLHLVAQVLRPANADRYHAARTAWAATMAPASAALGLRPPAITAAAWPTLLADCYPLHPTVLVALPQLLRKLIQGKRWLLTMLRAAEPWGLRDVLAAADLDAVELPIYRLTHFYAYLEHGLGPVLFRRARGRPWAELARRRVLLAAGNPLQFQVLTVVGTLGAAGLPTDPAQIAFALADVAAGPQAAPVFAALAALEQQGMLRYTQGET